MLPNGISDSIVNEAVSQVVRDTNVGEHRNGENLELRAVQNSILNKVLNVDQRRVRFVYGR